MNRASARSKSLTSTPRRRLRDLQHRLRDRVGVASAHPGHQVAERGLLHRVEAAGGAEVDEREAGRRRAASRCPGAGRRGTRPPAASARGTCAAASRRASRGRRRARVAPVDLAHARAVEPLHHEHARRAEVLVDVRARGCATSAGMRRGDRRARCAPRSGSRAPRAGAPRTRRRGPSTWYSRAPRRAGLDDVAELLEHREVDARPTRRCPGACTFTTTGEPSGSCARYTWPIDAAATGCQSKPANTSSTGASSSSSSSSAIASRGAGRHVVLQQRQLAPRPAARCRSVRVESDLAELHEHPAALLEREPEAAHRRPAAVGLDVVLAARGRATARARCAPRCG